MSHKQVEEIRSVRRCRPQKPFTHKGPRRLKKAEEPGQNRVVRLVDLTNKLLKELETVLVTKAFADETSRLQTLLSSNGIDLSQEVKRFEINLITLALTQTRSHQARAAKLLNISPATINSKIKQYGIEYCSLPTAAFAGGHPANVGR